MSVCGWATLASLLVMCCARTAEAPGPLPVHEPPGAIVPWAPDDAGLEGGNAESGVRSACAKACATFAKLGCPEARATDHGVSCVAVCVRGDALRKAPASCWAGAVTVEALRACGGVRCEGKEK